MSERFTIQISSEEAQYYRRIAELAGQSVESLLSETILPLRPIEDLDTQLRRVSSYSNAQLWIIVERIRLSGNEKSITLFIQALLVLRARGYDVNTYVQENNLRTLIDKP